MKFYRLIALLLIVPFVVGITGCSKGPGKDEVGKVYKAQIDYIQKSMKAFYVEPLKKAITEAKSLEDLNKVGTVMIPDFDKKFQAELEKLIVANGFKDKAAFDEAEKKLAEDKELKDWKAQKDKAFKDGVQQYQQELGAIAIAKQAELEGAPAEKPAEGAPAEKPAEVKK